MCVSPVLRACILCLLCPPSQEAVAAIFPIAAHRQSQWVLGGWSTFYLIFCQILIEFPSLLWPKKIAVSMEDPSLILILDPDPQMNPGGLVSICCCRSIFRTLAIRP